MVNSSLIAPSLRLRKFLVWPICRIDAAFLFSKTLLILHGLIQRLLDQTEVLIF